MSRFARLHSGPVVTWAPPESPLKIEYSTAIVREVRMASAGTDSFGVLYGVRQSQTIQILATRGRAGLDPVGIFASRVRGQVFLTEEDLERFEKNEASVALVLSGDKAGFFVRDAQGSMETVRSYREFFVSGPPPVTKVSTRKWPWAACLLFLPLFFYRTHPRPLTLTLHESADQLQISWDAPNEATLSIDDGGKRSIVAIHRDQTTATYVPRSKDVIVAIGSAEARYIRAPTEVDEARAAVEALESKIARLKASRAAGKAKILNLQRRLQ